MFLVDHIDYSDLNEIITRQIEFDLQFEKQGNVSKFLAIWKGLRGNAGIVFPDFPGICAVLYRLPDSRRGRLRVGNELAWSVFFGAKPGDDRNSGTGDGIPLAQGI